MDKHAKFIFTRARTTLSDPYIGSSSLPNGTAALILSFHDMSHHGAIFLKQNIITLSLTHDSKFLVYLFAFMSKKGKKDEWTYFFMNIKPNTLRVRFMV